MRKIIEFGFFQKKVSMTVTLFPTGLSGMFITDKGTEFVAVFLVFENNFCAHNSSDQLVVIRVSKISWPKFNPNLN